MANPAWGAAAGTVGQLLMQHTLHNQEREERERARQEAMVPRMLQAYMGPGEHAQPLEAGAALPEGAREIPIGERRFAAVPPPPEPTTFTARATRPGGVVQGAFETPEAAGEFTETFGVPAPPKPSDLPYSVSTGGITSRYATPEEALEARQRFRPPPGQGRAPTPSEQLSEKRFAVQNALGYAESLIREPRPGGGPGITFEEMVPELRRKFPSLTEAEAGGIASRANQNVGTERLTPVGQPVDRYGVGEALNAPPPPPRPFEKAEQQRGLLNMLLERDRPGAGAPSASGVAGETAAAPPRRRLAGPRATAGPTSAPAPQGQGAIAAPPVTAPGTAGEPPAVSPSSGLPTPPAGAAGPQELISAQGLIRAARGQGMDDSSIRERLVRAGYTDTEIAELLAR